ncbi:MAG: methyltransferase domain-containing protein [Magnetococcales bacterium]|nr:methyltransferase domain-containing protein [Magnetococcales bacterium]
MNLSPGSITRHDLVVVHRSQWSGQTIEVVDDGPLRILHFGTYLKQSCILRANPQRLVLPYTRHMLAVLAFNPQPRRVLMVGLGGGTMARFLLDHCPACQIDVVDIVPDMPGIARRFFGLPLSSRLRLHVDDGARFLTDLATRNAPPRFDLLLIDAYNALGMAESVYVDAFFRHCHTLLTTDGVMAINLSRSKTEVFSLAMTAIDHLFADSTRQFRPAGSNNVILYAARQPEPLRLNHSRPGIATRKSQAELALSDLMDPAHRQHHPWWKYILEF